MKKITKKKTIKKAKKIVIAAMPQPEAPKESDNIIASLASLQASPGWAIIVKILNDNVAYLEKAILEKYDPITKTELTDADVEILRLKRNLNIDVRETPQNYSKILLENAEEPVNYDPYFRTNDEIIRARKTANPDNPRG